jgi:hypothetical protein
MLFESVEKDGRKATGFQNGWPCLPAHKVRRISKNLTARVRFFSKKNVAAVVVAGTAVPGSSPSVAGSRVRHRRFQAGSPIWNKPDLLINI